MQERKREKKLKVRPGGSQASTPWTVCLKLYLSLLSPEHKGEETKKR